MTTPTLTKVVAATDIASGKTVFLTSCDAWTPDIAVAELLGTEDTDWRLAFANRLREVSNAVLVDAVEGEYGMAQLVAA